MGTALRAVGRHRSLFVGLAMLCLFLVAGFLLPLPYVPTEPNVSAQLAGPSAQHWFGTDASGFDVFSRTIAAARRDLPVALAGGLVSLVLGVPLGLLVGAKNRWSEHAMRVLDVFQAFPLVILSIAVVTILGDNLGNVVAAIALINIPRFMRLIRSEVLSLREKRFVEAARAMGASNGRVIFRHLLPNVMDVALVQFSIATANALIVIAALGFLGVGVSPPTPDWGLMIQQGAQQMTTGQWWTVVFPGLAILAAVTCFNAIAAGLNPSKR